MSYWKSYWKVMKVNSVISLCFLGALALFGFVLNAVDNRKDGQA